MQATGAEVIIGVDTGGDSLYKTPHAGFSAHLPTDITPDQDYAVIQSLAAVAGNQPGIKVLSAVVAPGVDSPSYANETLAQSGATRLSLSAAETNRIRQTYADWRMDGSGNQENRYGKTPLAWLHALQGNTGLQLLNLPLANLTSASNPWRAFTCITPAMAGVVLMDMQRHFATIKRG